MSLSTKSNITTSTASTQHTDGTPSTHRAASDSTYGTAYDGAVCSTIMPAADRSHATRQSDPYDSIIKPVEPRIRIPFLTDAITSVHRLNAVKKFRHDVSSDVEHNEYHLSARVIDGIIMSHIDSGAEFMLSVCGRTITQDEVISRLYDTDKDAVERTFGDVIRWVDNLHGIMSLASLVGLILGTALSAILSIASGYAIADTVVTSLAIIAFCLLASIVVGGIEYAVVMHVMRSKMSKALGISTREAYIDFEQLTSSFDAVIVTKPHVDEIRRRLSEQEAERRRQDSIENARLDIVDGIVAYASGSSEDASHGHSVSRLYSRFGKASQKKCVKSGTIHADACRGGKRVLDSICQEVNRGGDKDTSSANTASYDDASFSYVPDSCKHPSRLGMLMTSFSSIGHAVRRGGALATERAWSMAEREHYRYTDGIYEIVPYGGARWQQGVRLLDGSYLFPNGFHTIVKMPHASKRYARFDAFELFDFADSLEDCNEYRVVDPSVRMEQPHLATHMSLEELDALLQEAFDRMADVVGDDVRERLEEARRNTDPSVQLMRCGTMFGVCWYGTRTKEYQYDCRIGLQMRALVSRSQTLSTLMHEVIHTIDEGRGKTDRESHGRRFRRIADLANRAYADEGISISVYHESDPLRIDAVQAVGISSERYSAYADAYAEYVRWSMRIFWMMDAIVGGTVDVDGYEFTIESCYPCGINDDPFIVSDVDGKVYRVGYDFAVAALGLDEEVRCRPFFEEYVDDASVIIGGLCGDAKEDVGVDEDNAANVCVDDIGDDGNADVVVDAWRDATPCGSVHIR